MTLRKASPIGVADRDLGRCGAHPTAGVTPAKFAEFPKSGTKGSPFRSCQSLGLVFFPEITLPPDL
jgi:hypothetical protein